MKKLQKSWVWSVVIIIYLVGLTGFMVPASHDIFIRLIPFNILFAFAILVLGEEKITLSKFILFAICFSFGFVIELIGIETGVIFGEYTYGNSLGIKILGVPILIGVNWFFMVYTSLGLASKITDSRWAQTFLAPAFMVAYDYFLEPFAMQTGMWNWHEGIVPFQNYLAWYLGGLFLCTISVWGNFNLKNRFAAGLFVVQVVFFMVLFLSDLF